MSFDDKETLSQLMDGEWQDINTTKSVEAACSKADLKCKWSRYHLIRDVMRSEKVSVDDSLTSRICQAIEDEPSYSNISSIGARGDQSPLQSSAVESVNNDSVSTVSTSTASTNNKSTSSNSWKAGLGGLAVAASVALATVVGLNFWQGAPGNNGTANQTIASATMSGSAASIKVPGIVLPEVEYVSNRGSYWVTPESKRSAMAEKRLNMLMSKHIELSPTAERSGMLPYSRLLGYDSVNPE